MMFSHKSFFFLFSFDNNNNKKNIKKIRTCVLNACYIIGFFLSICIY